MKRIADFCADRLTVQERWLVLAFLGIVVLGSLVKYSRTRPVAHPITVPTLIHPHQPAIDTSP